MQSDPLGDLLSRVKQASKAGLASVVVPHSKMKLELLRVLEAEGYVAGHELGYENQFPTLRVHLRYDQDRRPKIQQLRRVSRPGLPVYRSSEQLEPIQKAVRILTTKQGFMTDREARRKGLGGEVICELY